MSAFSGSWPREQCDRHLANVETVFLSAIASAKMVSEPNPHSVDAASPMFGEEESVMHVLLNLKVLKPKVLVKYSVSRPLVLDVFHLLLYLLHRLKCWNAVCALRESYVDRTRFLCSPDRIFVSDGGATKQHVDSHWEHALGHIFQMRIPHLKAAVNLWSAQL